MRDCHGILGGIPVAQPGPASYADSSVSERPEARADSVYGHMKRILDFSARETGPNGICKGLRADWNDCLNLGGGESALVSELHFWALSHFIGLAERLGREEDVKVYSALREKVGRVISDCSSGKSGPGDFG